VKVPTSVEIVGVVPNILEEKKKRRGKKDGGIKKKRGTDFNSGRELTVIMPRKKRAKRRTEEIPKSFSKRESVLPQKPEHWEGKRNHLAGSSQERSTLSSSNKSIGTAV